MVFNQMSLFSGGFCIHTDATIFLEGGAGRQDPSIHPFSETTDSVQGCSDLGAYSRRHWKRAVGNSETLIHLINLIRLSPEPGQELIVYKYKEYSPE